MQRLCTKVSWSVKLLRCDKVKKDTARFKSVGDTIDLDQRVETWVEDNGRWLGWL